MNWIVFQRPRAWCCVSALCGLLLLHVSQAQAVFDHPMSAQQLLQGPLAQPAATLRGAAVMRGKFVYRKYLKEIPQPLASRGDFVFAQQAGIHWHTREPFDSEFILTSQGMMQRDQGQTTLQVDAAAQPAVKVVAQVFLALLSLDMSVLQDSFALFGTRQQASWQVGLRPRAAALAAVFKEAVVSGGAQVQSLVLRDANGDHAEIDFTDLSYVSALTADERKLFSVHP